MNIIQADRDAAASAYFAWIGPNPVIPGKMRAGEIDGHSMVQAFARHREASSAPLLEALESLADLFAQDGENSLDRFERLAAMFRKDTGYLAPGKDQPMGGADQPDGDELRAIYDAWFAAKVTAARAAISSARGAGK